MEYDLTTFPLSVLGSQTVQLESLLYTGKSESDVVLEGPGLGLPVSPAGGPLRLAFTGTQPEPGRLTSGCQWQPVAVTTGPPAGSQSLSHAECRALAGLGGGAGPLAAAALAYCGLGLGTDGHWQSL